MNKVNPDSWAAIVFLLFCAFAWWQISELPGGGDSNIGPKFFPYVMTATIALLSFGLLARSMWKKAAAEGETPHMPASGIFLRMALFIVLLAGYIFLYEPLGFLMSSAIMLPAGMFLLGERRILHAIIIPWIIIAIAYLAFTKVLMVPLPEFPIEF